MIRPTAAFLTLISVAGCLGTDCSNEARAEILSPDRSKKIVLFSRNCGATTGFNTQGTILNRTEDLPNEAGTVFIADKGPAKIAWVDDYKIIVTLGTGARVFKKETFCQGVAIEYRSK